MLLHFEAQNASHKLSRYILDYSYSMEARKANYDILLYLKDKVYSLDLYAVDGHKPVNPAQKDFSHLQVQDVWIDFLRHHFNHRQCIIFSEISNENNRAGARSRLFGSWVKNYQKNIRRICCNLSFFKVPFLELHNEKFYTDYFFIYSHLNDYYASMIQAVKNIVWL